MQIQLTNIIEDLTINNEILLEINEKEKNRLVTFANYSKNLLARVKVLNEEKLKIDREEKQKKLEIEKKCEDFKKDVCEKFNTNFPELEKLKSENAALRQRFEKLKSKFEVQLDNIITENKKGKSFFYKKHKNIF
jgi:flagellar motility protein MotE (MotC chaperone)